MLPLSQCTAMMLRLTDCPMPNVCCRRKTAPLPVHLNLLRWQM